MGFFFQEAFSLLKEELLRARCNGWKWNVNSQNKFSPTEFRLSDEGETLMTKEKIIMTLKTILKVSSWSSSACLTDFSRNKNRIDRRRMPQNDISGFIGDVMGTILSIPVVNFFYTPVFTMMEAEVVRETSLLIGYPPEESEGVFVPGGEFATILAFLMASPFTDPTVKENGVSDGNLFIFVSKLHLRHVEKASSVTGFGKEACIPVEVDRITGQIYISALEEAIQLARRESK
jgi:hypothetical protein